MSDTDAETTPRPVRAPSVVGRRAATVRGQQVRRRRSALLAVVVLLGGTAAARALEDPGDVRAVTAAQVAATSDPGADDPSSGDAARSAPDPVTTVTTTPGSGGPATATSLPTSTAPKTPAGAATTLHADADGSAARAPDTSRMPVPEAGNGRVVAMAIPAGPVAASGRTVRYSVEVEGGLPVSSAEFARTVMTVLTDRRGWQTKDGVRFVPVSPAQLAAGAAVDVRVTLASPRLTASLCAPLNVSIQQVSCWNGSRSVLNLTRWMHGSVTYGARLADYRTYLISHEVGHGLGHGHVSCPAAGTPAPVMVQQTKSLEGCTASPWPTGT